jgi:Domain of unknown function (DUF1707)
MAMRYYAPFPDGGEPLRPLAPHALRVGDAERDAAAADLGEHYTAGRLTLDELNERLEAVFSAKTFAQLTRIMADLPGPGRLSWWTGAGRQGDFGPRSGQGPQAPATDRAGRFAALSLLVLAMLIWLFTALLFARHGLYHPYGPPGSFGHVVHAYPGMGPNQP